MSLLDQAKKVKTLRATKLEPSPEHIELALGWVHGEVTFNQISSVLGLHTNSLYTILAKSLKRYIQDKEI